MKTAVGTPRGNQFNALLGIEYVFGHSYYQGMPENLQVVPLANVQYNRVFIEKFRQHGAGSSNLKIHSQEEKSLRTALGFRTNYKWSTRNVDYTPEINLQWQREFLAKKHHGRFELAEIEAPVSTFVIPGIGRNIFLGTLDLTVLFFHRYQLEGNYQFEWNKDYRDNSFFLTFSYFF